MSRQSAKTARRSTKTARRTVKKGAKPVTKSARKTVSKAPKPSKSARNPVGKSTRPTRAQPAAASKVAAKMIHTASPPVQPVAPSDLPIRSHKYQVGQVVYYTSPRMIPKKPVPDLIRDGNRFSDKVMRR
jgi:hypothetical protein